MDEVFDQNLEQRNNAAFIESELLDKHANTIVEPQANIQMHPARMT